MSEAIVLNLPDTLYQRLVNTAQATGQSLEAVVLRALKIGSPPDWLNVPEEFQADLSALDKVEDETLWAVARSQKNPEQMRRYGELLNLKQERQLTSEETLELETLRLEGDRFMLRKAHAAALLRWRGYQTAAIAA
jgi:hypothetical protein